MITPADIINLPKGQAFALLEGGRLWKIRMPLPDSANDPFMPESISRIAEYMQQNYRTGETWWTGSTLPSDSLTGSAFGPKDVVA